MSKNMRQRRQVASLTKMMTLYTVLKLSEKYGLKLDEILITISSIASSICGTTAQLVEGDVLSVDQLLYGLMLLSGNDAAYAIADHFGQIIIDEGHQTEYQGLVESEFKYRPTVI